MAKDLLDKIDKTRGHENRSEFIERKLRPLMFDEVEAVKLELMNARAYVAELEHRVESLKIKREVRGLIRGT